MAEVSATRPITPAQVRAVHAALGRRGIGDADYRAVLRANYGAASCKELTRRQASDLLARLGRPLPQAPGTPPAPRPPVRRAARPKPGPAAEDAVPRLASGAQRALAAALAGEVAWRRPDGFRRWLRAYVGVERVATARQAAQAIQGLKAMKARQRERRDG